METQIESLDSTRIKVTVTIAAETVDAAIKKGYRTAGAKYTIPGFRKGKAPRKVLDNLLGAEYVRANVTDDLVNEAYPQVIDSENLYPTGKPQFGEEELDIVEDGKDYVFSFELDVKPVYRLSSYEPITLELPKEEPSEEDIDEQLKALCEHYYDYVDAAEDAEIKDTDRVVLKSAATMDSGRQVDSLTKAEFTYTIGSGLLPAAFDEEIIGLKKGASKQFSMKMPEEATAYTAEVQGLTKAIAFDIEVVSIKVRSIPEPDDVFAKEKMGFEDLKDLREHIAESLAKQVRDMMPRLKEAQAMAQLTQRLEGEVPQAMQDAKEAELLQDFFRQLQEASMTYDQYLKELGMTAEQFKEDLKQQALDVCKEDLALDAWAAHAEITCSDSDLTAEFIASGADNPLELLEEWRASGRLYQIKEGIVRQKAERGLIDNAILKMYDPAEKAAEAAGEEKAE